MPERSNLPFVLACLWVLSSNASGGRAPHRVDDPATVPAATFGSPWEPSIAAVLLAARASQDPQEGPSSAEQLAALGAAAAPAMLDGLVSGRFLQTPEDPLDDLRLEPADRELLREALRLLGHDVLVPIAQAAASEQAGSSEWERGLLALELAGRSEDLDLAVAVPIDELDPRSLTLQRALERAAQAIFARDGQALRQLHRLLEGASPLARTALVRGVASSALPEAVIGLADELDKLPELECLLLSEITRAARAASPPYDPRAQAEVRERLTSNDRFVSRTAAMATGALQDWAALPTLIALLDSPSPGTRAAAHRALRDITTLAYPAEAAGWSHWLDREQTWFDLRSVELAGALESADTGRVVAALREIAAHRYRRQELAVLTRRALEHADPLVRAAARSTLAALGVECSENAPEEGNPAG